MVFTPNSQIVGISNTAPLRNVELKATLPSLATAAEVACRLTTENPHFEHQLDTYFRCQDGRLKLREIDIYEPKAQLIWYRRPDVRDAKTSQYSLIDVPEPAGLKQMLADAIGIQCVIDKQRTIYLYRNVRIHLDQVADCGCFLEFEAVLKPTDQIADGRKLVDWLRGQFHISAEQLVAGSYADICSK